MSYLYFFDGNIYQESNFKDNCDNLGDDFNSNVFDGNLSLGRIEEQNTIGDSSNIDLTPVMEYCDDQEEEDDRDSHCSEVETGEDYTE
jgi:hypothetical protein